MTTPLERKPGSPGLVRMSLLTWNFPEDHPIDQSPCAECDEYLIAKCSGSCGPSKVWVTEATYWEAILNGWNKE